MDVRKTLLKAARLLALTGAGASMGQAAAEAAISTDQVEARKSVAAAPTADPLFEVMQRTNGSLSAVALVDTLSIMFADPSPAQVEAIPGLIRSLQGLGASTEAMTQSRAVLIDRITASSKITEVVRHSVLDQLETNGNTATFKLAQSQEEQRRRRREREEIGQTPGAPAAAS